MRVPDLDDEDEVCFEDYTTIPGIVPSFASDDIMTKVAKRLHGGAGPGGADSHLLRDMLLRFNRASIEFRLEMAAWVDYMANDSPPIAGYRAFANGLLLAGNKQPGVRQINCGEIFCRYWAKVMMEITGFQAKEECGSIELCSGLAAGLEGAIHAVRQTLTADEWTDPPGDTATA